MNKHFDLDATIPCDRADFLEGQFPGERHPLETQPARSPCALEVMDGHLCAGVQLQAREMTPGKVGQAQVLHDHAVHPELVQQAQGFNDRVQRAVGDQGVHRHEHLPAPGKLVGKRRQLVQLIGGKINGLRPSRKTFQSGVNGVGAMPKSRMCCFQAAGRREQFHRLLWPIVIGSIHAFSHLNTRYGITEMTPKEKLSSTMHIVLPPGALPSEDGTAKKFVFKKSGKHLVRLQKPILQTAQSDQSHYEQLLQGIYDALIITDFNGNILETNPRASELLQYEGRELRQLSVLDLIAGATPHLMQTLGEYLPKERFALIQAFGTRKDKTSFPAEISVNLLVFDELRMCFLVRDVTVRKQAEDALHSEHNALQNALTGIAIADTEGKLTYVNPVMVKWWGCVYPEELLVKHVYQLWTDEALARRKVAELLEERRSWSDPLVARRVDGSTFPVQVAAACNLDTDNRLTGLVMSLVDLTDQKKAEEAMKETERHKAMLASLGAACHHIGQPATVLLTNLDLLSRRLQRSDPECNHLFEDTQQSARQIGDLLNTLNKMAMYRTTAYLENAVDPSSEGNVILDI